MYYWKIHLCWEGPQLTLTQPTLPRPRRAQMSRHTSRSGGILFDRTPRQIGENAIFLNTIYYFHG